MVARGSAQCLNLNCCLVLIPTCRHSRRDCGRTRLRFVVPFDALRQSHIFFGCAILFFTTLPCVSSIFCEFYPLCACLTRRKSAHLSLETNLVSFQRASQTAGNFCVEAHLVSLQGSSWWCVCLIAISIYGCASKYVQFILVHTSFTPCHVDSTLASMGQPISQSPTSPCIGSWSLSLCTSCPDFFVRTPLSRCEVLDVAIKKGNVIGIKLARPKSWDNVSGRACTASYKYLRCLGWNGIHSQ
jgi:hypothetical protein